MRNPREKDSDEHYDIYCLEDEIDEQNDLIARDMQLFENLVKIGLDKEFNLEMS